MADFDPRQLDQLEDALERLDDHEDLESLELSPEVIERLHEYEDVLALCREAFPLESPPDESLTAVLQEAREVSRRPRSRDAEQRSGWRRFWERWRGTVVPGLALATTAVVMLWILDPTAEHATELTSDPSSEHADAPSELERSQPASESSNATRSEIAKSDDEPIAEPPAPAPDPELRKDVGSAQERQQPAPKPGSGGGASKPTKSKVDDSYDEPAPEPAPMNKDETWTSLERADAARRSGNCDRARSLYEDVISASSDALAIAQAKGGIGLCFEQDHRDSDAKKWFDDARAASPGVDAWINSQRDEQPLPGETKKAPSKKDHFPAEADAL